VLCLGCHLVKTSYLDQVACSIDATTFNEATGSGSRVAYDSRFGPGFALCLIGSLLSLVAGSMVASLHYPGASFVLEAAKVQPADAKKLVEAEEGHPLDAKS